MAASRPVGSHKANVAFTLAQVVLKESRHGDENDDDEGGDHRRPGTENRPSTFCGYKNQKKKKNLPKGAIKEPCTQQAWPAGKGENQPTSRPIKSLSFFTGNGTVALAATTAA